jgi:hypothetical protein
VFEKDVRSCSAGNLFVSDIMAHLNNDPWKRESVEIGHVVEYRRSVFKIVQVVPVSLFYQQKFDVKAKKSKCKQATNEGCLEHIVWNQYK